MDEYDEDDELEGIDVENHCTCNIIPWKAHSCPYRDEYEEYYEPRLCHCCPFCTRQCRNDI